MIKESFKRIRKEPELGNMQDRIILHVRTLTPPIFNGVDFTEDFKGEEIWAQVNTAGGKMFFKGIGSDISLTHEIVIRYKSTVTSETWVELKNRNLKIVDVENWNEENNFMILRCVDKGDKDLGASQV